MQPVDEYLNDTSPERFLHIYESLAERGFGPLDGEVAKLLKFRPQAIRKLPMDQRAKKARGLLQHRSDLAYELLGSYLIKTNRDLITDFLDATGIEHDEGMIEDVEEGLPDESKLEATVTELDQKYTPEDVTLYLSMCAYQWPESAGLQKLWKARSAAKA